MPWWPLGLQWSQGRLFGFGSVHGHSKPWSAYTLVEGWCCIAGSVLQLSIMMVHRGRCMFVNVYARNRCTVCGTHGVGVWVVVCLQFFRLIIRPDLMYWIRPYFKQVLGPRVWHEFPVEVGRLGIALYGGRAYVLSCGCE